MESRHDWTWDVKKDMDKELENWYVVSRTDLLCTNNFQLSRLCFSSLELFLFNQSSRFKSFNDPAAEKIIKIKSSSQLRWFKSDLKLFLLEHLHCVQSTSWTKCWFQPMRMKNWMILTNQSSQNSDNKISVQHLYMLPGEKHYSIHSTDCTDCTLSLY